MILRTYYFYMILHLCISNSVNTNMNDTSLCLNQKYSTQTASYRHIYWKLHDLSWVEYCKEVYSKDITSSEAILDANKNDINFYYRNTRSVRVLSINWFDTATTPLLYGKGYEQHTNPYVFGYKSSIAYQDQEWIEVSRFSSSFYNWNISITSGDSDYNNKVYEGEGYSSGFFGNSKKVAYGCWFMISKGSGVYVNTGHTYILQRGGDSLNILFQKFSYKMNYANHCINGDDSKKCVDKYLCTAALSLGYDSIQIPFKNEFVLCSKKCAYKLFSETCPRIELRAGAKANKNCNCSNDSPLLNCDNSNFNRNSRLISTNIDVGSTIDRRPIACISSSILMKEHDHHHKYNLSFIFLYQKTAKGTIIASPIPSQSLTTGLQSLLLNTAKSTHKSYPNQQTIAIHLYDETYDNDHGIDNNTNQEVPSRSNLYISIGFWSTVWRGKYAIMNLDNYQFNDTDVTLKNNLLTSTGFTPFTSILTMKLQVNSIIIELNRGSDSAAALHIGIIFYRSDLAYTIDNCMSMGTLLGPTSSHMNADQCLQHVALQFSSVARRLQDEAICLRTAGAKLVGIVQTMIKPSQREKEEEETVRSKWWKQQHLLNELHQNISSSIDFILNIRDQNPNNFSKTRDNRTNCNSSYDGRMIPIFDAFSQYTNILQVNRNFAEISFNNTILLP